LFSVKTFVAQCFELSREAEMLALALLPLRERPPMLLTSGRICSDN
jgi:hypothetical protein